MLKHEKMGNKAWPKNVMGDRVGADVLQCAILPLTIKLKTKSSVKVSKSSNLLQMQL